MSKISQKKTCKRCKCLNFRFQPVLGFCCGLGYKMNEDMQPLEPCPKPLTLSALFGCRVKERVSSE